ncbi:MAG: hypothetical protein QOE93_2539 [Actinomycetota bacterium]|jgi:uncharacterized protein (TIGR02246 family)|nr:hypothetical protein [Actinomycetota bacterium]
MADAEVITALHRDLLDAWNRGDADGFAESFTGDGSMVGFDGSPIDGREEIRRHLAGIFADHQTAAYVGKVREVRFLGPDVALLRAAVGMIPPGQDDINPDTNAIQGLVAVREHDAGWRIALFQNTPAAFHGRPEAVEELTSELRRLRR